MSTTPRDPRPVRSAATGAAAAAAPAGAPPLLDRAGRYVRRQAWVTGAWVLLALLLILGVATHPTGFSSFDVQTLVLGSMPLAFAAMAQAVVVISGGIDLSVGAAMSVFNVASARLFENASFPQAVGLSFALMACGVLVGAGNGLLVVLTRVPDIVVTLATSFVLAGVALAILNTPGGGAPLDYGNLVQGGLGTDWLPEGVLVLAAVLLVFWLPLRLSRPGLALYAIGSSRKRGVPERGAGGLDQDPGLRDGRPVRLPRRPRPDRHDGQRQPDRRQHLHPAVVRRDRAGRGAAGRRAGRVLWARSSAPSS